MTIFRLWVMSRDADDRPRTVGQLWRAPSAGFRFAYESALPTDFHPLAEFPEVRGADRPYEARHLFATFAERIPSPRRPDYDVMMKSWGVDQRDDQLEVLARSGGIQATDWLELSEWRAPDDDLTTPLLVRVAGTRNWAGRDHVHVGDAIALRREPDNAWDTHATELVLPSGEKLGYIPRPYTALVAGLLDGGVVLGAHIERRLGIEQTYPRWHLLVRRADAAA